MNTLKKATFIEIFTCNLHVYNHEQSTVTANMQYKYINYTYTNYMQI